MKEYIGTCIKCEKPVYCLDGFLNGAIVEGKVICFQCEKDRKDS